MYAEGSPPFTRNQIQKINVNTAASMEIPQTFDLLRMFKSCSALNHPWFLQGHSTTGAKGQDNIRNYDDITCMCIEI